MSDHQDRDLALLENHVIQLQEHFDTVQIFVTRHAPRDEGGTINANCGKGNWYARYGQVSAWLLREETQLADPPCDDDEDD